MERFSADPMEAIARWEELSRWAETIDAADGDEALDESALGPCVPRPQKVFGIGLNYRDHAAEAGLDLPEQPMVFTKFPSCLVGPRADVVLTSNRVDWEVELVVVMGRARLADLRGRRPRLRGGLLRGPGHLRPPDAVRRQAAAVLPGKVRRHLRTDRAGGGLARRVRGPERSRADLRSRRRTHAGRPHARPWSSPSRS